MRILGWNYRWIGGSASSMCSMLCIEISPRWCIHFGIERRAWVFGHQLEPYAQCADHWGFGPFFDIIRWNGSLG